MELRPVGAEPVGVDTVGEELGVVGDEEGGGAAAPGKHWE